jgi:hypothetical protein
MESAAIEQDSTRNKGGRPPLPPVPTGASDTRALIAQEIVKTKPSASRLRYLRALLKSFEDAEAQAKAEAAAAVANRLQQEANHLKQTELEQQRLEYQRRRELGKQRQSAEDAKKTAALQDELAVQQQQNDTLRHENNALRSEAAECAVLRDKNATLTVKVAALQQQADELATIKAAASQEFGSLFNTDARVSALRAEFDSLKEQEPTQVVLDRMKTVIMGLKTLQHAYQIEVVT